ncbi:MAG: hypothetical protein GXP55_21665 [Deltaproteobacteria bacterium]|nr:hypothetical protein [Deltaproteobacteria bacterium]
MTKSRLTLSVLAAVVLLAGCDGVFERARRLLDVDLPGSAPRTTAPAALMQRSGDLGPGVQRAAYEIPVEAGATVIVHLHSDAFDPVLEVTPPGGGALSNDDFGGSRTDSELSISTTTAGSLKVVASSVNPSAVGAFQLRVVPSGRQPEGGALLQPGSPQPGRLGPGDATLGDGRWVKRYLVRVGAAPLSLNIRATSMTIPNALVIDPEGRVMPTAQSGAYRLSRPGLYRVQLMSPGPGQTAGFEMLLASAAAPEAAPPSVPRAHHALPRTGSDVPLALDAEVTGTLGAGVRLATGEPADVYRLEITADSPALNISMTSDSLDAYLVLVAPDGSVLEDDDSGGGTDASLSFTPSLAGSYRLIASSYRADMSGEYRLALTPSSRVAGASAPATGTTARTLTGRLEQGDTQLRSGEFVDDYPMTLAEGQTLRLRARSSDFDTYLIVHPPSGDQVDNDDGENGTDAELEFTARVSGEHRVQVTSYRPGETGAYSLEVSGADVASAGAAGSTAASGAPADGPRANPPRPGGPRVFGLFAGISDYPEGINDLPECANDARKLAETLEGRGIASSDHIVLLTDAEATRDAVRGALRRASRELGPDDVFIFFWSGHGSRTAGSRDSREIDGMDESIILYDGAMIDDELGELFDRLRARIAIVALDSCYSGGFAKDVVTRPGVVGLFSSEEDVLSSVASQFQAGGYLSHFLRTGMGGEADRAPRDGTLTVGELTHYMRQRFARQASDVRLAGAYQELVVDRGAVGVDETLWRFPR